MATLYAAVDPVGIFDSFAEGPCPRSAQSPFMIAVRTKMPECLAPALRRRWLALPHRGQRSHSKEPEVPAQRADDTCILASGTRQTRGYGYCRPSGVVGTTSGETERESVRPVRGR